MANEKRDDRRTLEAQVLTAREALSLIAAADGVDPEIDPSEGRTRPPSADQRPPGLGGHERAA